MARLPRRGGVALAFVLSAACVVPDIAAEATASALNSACASLQAAEFAQAAYGDGCAHATGRGATACRMHERPNYAGRAFVSVGADCVVTLNIRGSNDFTDVLANANFIGTSQPTPLLGSWRIFGSGAGVHPGFANTLEGLASAVDDSFEEAKRCGDRARIRIFGHSLGGAVAFLAHAQLRERLPNVPIKTETVGAPSAGNCDWAAGLAGEDIVNHVNEHDIVPHLPPIGLGYCANPGRTIAYEDGESIPFYRLGHSHLPSAYIESVTRACNVVAEPPPDQPASAPISSGVTVSCSDGRSLRDQCWSAFAETETGYRRAIGFSYWTCADYRRYYDERPSRARDDHYWMCGGLVNACIDRTRAVCSNARMPRDD